ncbi:MAG: dioxygenase, partial [Pseudomonas sp.]
MTVKISQTADVQNFFHEVAGINTDQGTQRFKQIVLRIIQDAARLIEDLEISDDEFWKAVDYLNRMGTN